MDVKLIPLSELLPLEGNSKRHDTDNIVRSMLEYGYRDYIEVDTVFSPPRIVCGNDRRNGLERLKEEDKPIDGIVVKGDEWLVPCIVKKSATKDDAIRYSIDNNLSTIKGANLALEDEIKLFDEDLLKEQLDVIDDLVVGWDSDEIFVLTEVDQQDINDQQESNSNYSTESQELQSTTKEIDPDSYEFDHKCPKCGFEFDD